MSSDIRLEKEETALWNEVGSRGDHFREAMRDKALEQVRVTQHNTEIVKANGDTAELISEHDPVPEKEVTLPLPPPVPSQDGKKLGPA